MAKVTTNSLVIFLTNSCLILLLFITITNNAWPKDMPSVPKLIKALKDQDEEIRWAASVLLARMGPEAKSEVPALIEVLKDQNDEISQNAAEALA
jgi:HEAT repeat protein